MLRYYGWFGELVPDSPLESWRVRKVDLLLYPEDDSMQVTEPPAPNSGIMQVGAGRWASMCCNSASWALVKHIRPRCLEVL